MSIEDGHPSARVLLLEDDDALRGTIAKLLRKRGYEVISVPSGQEAVQAASQQHFDLIITDIRMDGIDGLEALQKVKDNQPDISSVVMTGYSTEEDSIRAIRLGVGEYLKKPFRLPALLNSVSQIIDRRQSQKVGHLLSATLLSLLEASCQNPQWAASAHRAALVGRNLGIEDEEALWLQAAVLARAMQDEGLELNDLPERLQSVVDEADEPWRTISRPSRVVAAVLQLHSDLEHYDPDVLKALSLNSRDEKPSSLNRRMKGLLTLAEALRVRGDSTFAKEALSQICSQGQGGRSVAQAKFSLSELELLDQRPEESFQCALEALQEALQVGPRFHGELHLRAALLWLTEKPDEARAWLETASRLAREVKDEVLFLSAQIGSLCGGFSEGDLEQSLASLRDTANPVQITECLGWLLPSILELEQSVESEVLAAWTGEYPEVFDLFLDRVSSAEDQVLRALVLFERQGTKLSESTQKTLLAHASETVRESVSRLDAGQANQRKALSIASFGQFKIMGAGESVNSWKTQKVRYLFAYLSANLGRRSTDDELIEAFWPKAELAKGKKSLNTNLSFLRSHLRKNLELEDVVLRDPEGTSLDPKAVLWHDLEEFRKCAKAGAAQAKAGSAELEATLRQMMDLCRGDYLEGCYMEWASENRRQLERYAREGSRKLTHLCDKKQMHAETLEAGFRALDFDPCQEDVAACVLRAYQAQGKREEAIRFYRGFVKTLNDELEVEPTEEFVESFSKLTGNG